MTILITMLEWIVGLSFLTCVAAFAFNLPTVGAVAVMIILADVATWLLSMAIFGAWRFYSERNRNET